MKENKLFKTLFSVLFYLFWSVFLQLPLNLFNIRLSSNMMALYEFVFTFLLLILIFMMYKQELIKEFKFNKKIKYIFINTVAIFMIMGISNMISYSILGDNVVSKVNNSGLSIIDTKNLLMIIRLLVLTPIIEELVFRKSVRTVVNNDIFFVIFSGLFLGSLYVIAQTLSFVGLISSISYILVGIYLSISYVKTNNIYINIFSRILYNLLMLVIILWSGYH